MNAIYLRHVVDTIDFSSMTGSLILDVAYGIKVKPEHDRYVEIAERAQEGMDKSMDAVRLVLLCAVTRAMPTYAYRRIWSTFSRGFNTCHRGYQGWDGRRI